MPTACDTTAAAEADGLRIDESERKSWASIAFIRAGGMFSAPTLMVGASLGLGLALGGAALATLVGFGFIVAYMCFVSMQASDLGLPTASLAAPPSAGARHLAISSWAWLPSAGSACRAAGGGASLAPGRWTVFGLAVPVGMLGDARRARAGDGARGLRRAGG